MTDPTVSACPIFQGFTIEEYEQVLKLLDHESYESGAVIIKEGDSRQTLWIVVRGRCEVVKRKKNGQQAPLASLEAGAVFGEMSFFQTAPHSATVRALSQVEVMQLTRERYDRLCERCPSAAHKIALSVNCLLAARLRRMDELDAMSQKVRAASAPDPWLDYFQADHRFVDRWLYELRAVIK